MSILLPGAPQSSDPLDRGLVLDFELTRPTGDVVFDASGYRFVGGLTGSVAKPTWSGSRYGTVLHFQGDGFSRSDAIVVDNSEWIADGWGEITYEAFFEAHSVSFFPRIISKSDGMTAYLDISPYVHCEMWVGETRYHVVYRGFSLYEWTHLIVTYDSDVLRLYTNNLLRDEETGPSGPLDPATSIIRIGTDNISGGSNFNGHIALVRVYNRALSAAEVRRRYEICTGRASGVTRLLTPSLLSVTAVPGEFVSFSLGRVGAVSDTGVGAGYGEEVLARASTVEDSANANSIGTASISRILDLLSTRSAATEALLSLALSRSITDMASAALLVDILLAEERAVLALGAGVAVADTTLSSIRDTTASGTAAADSTVDLSQALDAIMAGAATADSTVDLSRIIGIAAGIVTGGLSGSFDNVPWDDLSSLTYLRLNNTDVSGDIGNLSGLTSLVYLSLANTNVTGDIADLSGLALVTELYLNNTDVSGGDIAGNIAIESCRVQDCGWDQATVDAFLQAMYTARANYTYATPDLNIGGTNATPSGVYQDADPPTTGLEYIYKLVNDPDSEGFNTWSITWNGGSAP